MTKQQIVRFLELIHGNPTAEDIQVALRLQEINLSVSLQKLSRHMRHTPHYHEYHSQNAAAGKPQPSYFIEGIGCDDVRMLIHRYAGTGLLVFQDDRWRAMEYIADVGRNIGYTWSWKDSEMQVTNALMIHYSQRGCHAYPDRPRR